MSETLNNALQRFGLRGDTLGYALTAPGVPCWWGGLVDVLGVDTFPQEDVAALSLHVHDAGWPYCQLLRHLSNDEGARFYWFDFVEPPTGHPDPEQIRTVREMDRLDDDLQGCDCAECRPGGDDPDPEPAYPPQPEPTQTRRRAVIDEPVVESDGNFHPAPEPPSVATEQPSEESCTCAFCSRQRLEEQAPEPEPEPEPEPTPQPSAQSGEWNATEQSQWEYPSPQARVSEDYRYLREQMRNLAEVISERGRRGGE